MLFIFCLIFLDLLSYGMMVPLLPLYVQQAEGGAALAGALSAVYAGMQLFSGPVLGALSDQQGRRPVMLACLLGTALAYIILGFSNGLPMIFLAVALDGLTGGNLTTAYAYIADSTTPEKRAQGMSLVGAAFGLGIMVGPVLGGWLSGYGLRFPAFVAAGLAVGNALFCLLLVPESLPPEKRAPAARGRNGWWQLVDLWRNPALQQLLLAIFLLNLAFAGLQANFPLFSQARFQWNPTQTGLFYAYVGVCAVVIQGGLFARIQPRFGEKRLVLAGLACMALGLLGLAWTPVAWGLYPAVTVVALGTGLSIPSLTSLVSQRLPAAEQGRLMGGTQVLLSLTSIFGPTLAGVVFEYGHITAPYVLGSGFAVAAWWVAWRALRHAH